MVTPIRDCGSHAPDRFDVSACPRRQLFVGLRRGRRIGLFSSTAVGDVPPMNTDWPTEWSSFTRSLNAMQRPWQIATVDDICPVQSSRTVMVCARGQFVASKRTYLAQFHGPIAVGDSGPDPCDLQPACGHALRRLSVQQLETTTVRRLPSTCVLPRTAAL